MPVLIRLETASPETAQSHRSSSISTTPQLATWSPSTYFNTMVAVAPLVRCNAVALEMSGIDDVFVNALGMQMRDS